MRNYLINGAASLVIGMVATGCSHDFDGNSDFQQASLDNAQETLGFYIPSNQDWVLSSEASASITVNGDYGVTYQVIVYENNPFVDNTGTVLARGSVMSGGTFTADFRYPTGSTSVYAAIRDEKGYTYLKPAVIADGRLVTSFGNTSSAARTRVTTRGSEADAFVIPTYKQPDLSAYINDATPITAENNNTLPSNKVRHYVIPAGTTWSENIPLIQASDPNSKDVVSVYVLGTLNINEEQRINGGYGDTSYKFIVGNGGVVNIAAGVKLVSNANQGNNNIAGEIHILAGGTIQGEGTLEFANGSNPYNYNAGTINVGTLNNNGGTLYNVGTILADHLDGGAGGSVYVNNGKVHVGEASKGSNTANMRILNNCWWECDGEEAGRNIVQGPGAYLKAASLDMSGATDGSSDREYIYVKGNSLLDIAGDVKLNNIDIVGPESGDYGFIQFGRIAFLNYDGGWNNTTITHGFIIDNVYISVDNPSGSVKYYDFQGLFNGLMWGNSTGQLGNGNAQIIQKGQANVATVTESDCSPGVTIVPPTIIEDNSKIWTYAFEDSNRKSDYDMNDVVIKVSESEDGKTLYFSLVAAGCEFDNEVYFNGTVITWNNGETEVHKALGVDKGTLTNTNARTGVSNITPATWSCAKPSGFDYQTADIKIKPGAGDVFTKQDGGDGFVHLASTGSQPTGIVIPADWQWPTERVNIVNAYSNSSHSFAAWASQANVDLRTASADWFKYPTGSVMK